MSPVPSSDVTLRPIPSVPREAVLRIIRMSAAIVLATLLGVFSVTRPRAESLAASRGEGRDGAPASVPTGATTLPVAFAGASRQAPSIYYSVPPTTVYSPDLQVIVSICHEDGIASSSVTSTRGDVQPDAQADCGSGETGTAYFVTWDQSQSNELLYGANDLSVSACSAWPSSECTYPTVYYNLALPIDNNLTLSLLDPTTELAPGQTDTIRIRISNSDTFQKTISFTNGVKCVDGLGNCAMLDVSATVPAKGTKPGLDTVRVRVRGDSLGMGVANIHGCRSVGPPPTQICVNRPGIAGGSTP